MTIEDANKNADNERALMAHDKRDDNESKAIINRELILL